MPALQKSLYHSIDELATIIRVENSWHTEVGEELVIECSTHIDSMLALKWIGKVEFWPVVDTMQYPVVFTIWKMAHVNEINLFRIHKIIIAHYKQDINFTTVPEVEKESLLL